MKNLLRIVVIVLCCFAINVVHAESENIFLIKNELLTLGILPNAGAHIVLLKYNDSPNLLQSDETLWDKDIPELNAEDPVFLPLCGHITWLSPQKEWWAKQDLNVKKRDSCSAWPPDPFLTLGKYKIVKRTESSVSLSGEPSPVSKVKMNIDISLNENKVNISVSAKNVSEEEIAWGLWSNTRLAPTAKFYFPADEVKSLRAEVFLFSPLNQRLLNYKIINGFLTFDTESVQKGSDLIYMNKLFINTDYKTIAGFVDKFLFLKTICTDVDRIHPDHSPIEVYLNLKDVLELEAHGSYVKLKPHDVITLEEVWEIIPYQLGDDPAEQVEFLKSILSSKRKK